ncbi:hypothetical protein [Planotetraspora silvatica]
MRRARGHPPAGSSAFKSKDHDGFDLFGLGVQSPDDLRRFVDR